MAKARFKKTLVPFTLHDVPALPEPKEQYYLDYPLVSNEAVTQRPFFINPDSIGFTFVTSDANNTQLYKWNGGGWTEITGFCNPDIFYGHGFYAVTTSAAAYVAVTEQREPNIQIAKDKPR